jgi:hypothetical protein
MGVRSYFLIHIHGVVLTVYFSQLHNWVYSRWRISTATDVTSYHLLLHWRVWTFSTYLNARHYQGIVDSVEFEYITKQWLWEEAYK